MEVLDILVVIIISLSLLNVWLLRFNKPTPYRGGDATNMIEEFKRYGLPLWFMYTIGFLKIALSLSLIASIWFDVLQLPSALGIAVLMLGSLAMHIKIHDPIKKYMPAISFLLLSLFLVMTNL